MSDISICDFATRKDDVPHLVIRLFPSLPSPLFPFLPYIRTLLADSPPSQRTP